MVYQLWPWSENVPDRAKSFDKDGGLGHSDLLSPGTLTRNALNVARQEGVIETFDSISQMLSELGPTLDVLEITAFEEQESWAIALDDAADTTLALDYDAATAKLYISADLGAPPSDHLLATYDFLLQYNAFWAETGGVRMALDGPAGNVLQLFDMSLHDLQAHQLGNVLQNFAAQIQVMRAMLAKGIGTDDAATPDPSNFMMREGSIQA